MRIDVTQEDIEKANELRKLKRPFSQICPIYQALKRLGVDVYNVTTGSIRQPRTPGSILYISIPLPDTVTRKIDRWDRTKKMVPFSFEVEVE